jgi:hypothetical protein
VINILTVHWDLLGLSTIGTWAVTSFCAGTVCWRAPLPLASRLFWLYVVSYSLWLAMFPLPHFGDFTRAFQASAGWTLAIVLLLPLAVLQLNEEKWLRGFQWYVAGKLALVWIEPWLPKMLSSMPYYAEPGAVLSASFDMALAAAYLPFAPLWLRCFTLATVATHHAGTALLILVAQVIALAIRKRFWLLLAVPALFLPLVHLNSRGGRFWDGWDRLEHWESLFHFWLHGPAGYERPIVWRYLFFGVGPGTLLWSSMILDPKATGQFGSMHSDWLQIPWELGAVGLTLALATAVVMLRRAWNSPQLFCAVAALLTFGLTYHPLRFPAGMLLATLIAKRALTEQENLLSFS